MRKSALIIGTFTATETGYTGKLDTLAIKANLTFERNDDKAQDNHPDFTIVSRLCNCCRFAPRPSGFAVEFARLLCPGNAASHAA